MYDPSRGYPSWSPPAVRRPAGRRRLAGRDARVPGDRRPPSPTGGPGTSSSSATGSCAARGAAASSRALRHHPGVRGRRRRRLRPACGRRRACSTAAEPPWACCRRFSPTRRASAGCHEPRPRHRPGRTGTAPSRADAGCPPTAAARTPRPAAARRGAPRSAKARWAATYSCLPAGVSMRHRREAEVGEVVRRGAHVELADVPRELEAVGHQLRGDQRGEPERVLVEVHPGVQAARLLELDAGRRGPATGC